jgi:hypothetical protein
MSKKMFQKRRAKKGEPKKVSLSRIAWPLTPYQDPSIIPSTRGPRVVVLSLLTWNHLSLI